MVSVVIGTHNRAESLRGTLESLSGMSVPRELEWELIVVDNNSSDNTRAVVEEFAQTSPFEVRYFFETRQGLSHARNTGVARAAGEIIAFTDDDVTMAPEWLRELVRAFGKFDCAGVGGKSIPAWGGLTRPKWLALPGPYYLGTGPLLDFNQGPEAKLIQTPPFGLNMAFRKSVFAKYGLFRADICRAGAGGLLGADTEFGQRLIRAGEKIAYAPKAIVYHPVPKERLTRSYFLTHQYRLGRGYVRTLELASGLVRWFGVPRTYFRSLLESSWRWLVAFRSAEKFYHKAQVWLHLGRIAESWKLRGEARGDSIAAPASITSGNARAFEATLLAVIEECVAASGHGSIADAADRQEPPERSRD
ncbi:MAG TPA: glycosyltransferase [Terriglobia bacterium]|nr:glycosyltransferase [Terriglobia bacterium]